MGMNFDGWLEQELDRRFQHAATGAPVPRYASLPYLPGRGLAIRTLATAAKSKVAIAATAAVLATGGGVGAKAAITGNPNPFNWGHQVQQHVVTCKQNLPSGQHGIGRCVSDFATQHGVQERQQHSPAGSHPTGPPASHPRGPPASHPTGPPASLPHPSDAGTGGRAPTPNPRAAPGSQDPSVLLG